MKNLLSRRAFSLVELLMVLAIVAILLSLLLPTITLVRDMSQRVSCGTRLRGLAAAMLAYANEWNGRMPRNGVRQETESRADHNNWINFEMFPLQRGNMSIPAVDYLTTEGGFEAKTVRCPGVSKTTDQRTTWGWGYGASGLQMGSFRSDYTYWNQADNTAGDNKGPTPYSVAPWARRRLGADAPNPNPSRIFVNNGRWPIWLHQRDDDLASAPLFSDFAMRSPWYDDYSHGRSLSRSYANTVHLDGHLSGRRIDVNDPYLALQATSWGGCMIYNYR